MSRERTESGNDVEKGRIRRQDQCSRACPEWQRGLTLYSISVRGDGVDATVSADLTTNENASLFA